MLKSVKSQLTCSYCSKIFKDPILLPCEDSICREHLSDRDIVKQNKIKCKKCNEEFQVKNNEFKSNEAISKLIDSHSHLNETEMSLKQDLEVSIRQFFEFYDEFTQNRTQLDSDVFDHFQEIRFKIDQHREELKKRIDDIALAMIDKTNKYQEKYLQD
jgi:transposase-like protein